MIIFFEKRVASLGLCSYVVLVGLYCHSVNLFAEVDESRFRADLERAKEMIALAEGDCEDCLSTDSCAHCNICADDKPPPKNRRCVGPETQTELAARITTANSNNRNDVIDLCGKTIQLTTTLDLTDGNTGLPAIEGDNSHTLTIKNGTIERFADPSNRFRIFLVTSPGTLIIEDLNLANGFLAGQQGACIKNHGSLSVKDSRLENCITQSINFTQDAAGGAIYNDGEIPQIKNSVIANSVGGVGSGIYNSNIIGAIACSHIVNNGEFGGSQGGSGGGISNEGVIGLITHDIFEGNKAISQVAGGGIENKGLIITIENSSFFLNNGGLYGGAIRNPGQIDKILNSTFTRNRAGAASALMIEGSLLLLANSTISDNQAYLAQGAIFINGTLESMISTIVANNICTFEDDCFTDVYGNVGNESYNLIGTNADSNILAGDPNSNNSIVGTPEAPIDPGLGSLGFYGGPTPTMPLLIDSPAIINGANPDELLYDQRGPDFDRETRGYTDIGAYQTQEPCSKCPEDLEVSFRHHDHSGGGGFSHNRGFQTEFFDVPPPIPPAPGPIPEPVPMVMEVTTEVDPDCVESLDNNIKTHVFSSTKAPSADETKTAMGCSLIKNNEPPANGFWFFALLFIALFRKRSAFFQLR